jgi:hypothetical protein
VGMREWIAERDFGLRSGSPPFTTAGFARMIERAGKAAKLSLKPHPHMLDPFVIAWLGIGVLAITALAFIT